MDVLEAKMRFKSLLRTLYQEGFDSNDILELFNDTAHELTQELGD